MGGILRSCRLVLYISHPDASSFLRDGELDSSCFVFCMLHEDNASLIRGEMSYFVRTFNGTAQKGRVALRGDL